MAAAPWRPSRTAVETMPATRSSSTRPIDRRPCEAMAQANRVASASHGRSATPPPATNVPQTAGSTTSSAPHAASRTGRPLSRIGGTE